MQVFDAIKTMLAVRSYTDQPIDPATVTRIVQAARLTGSSRNRQEWDFIVSLKLSMPSDSANLTRNSP
jgi:nitroreductase